MCSAERVGGEAAVFRDLTAHDPVTITSDLPIQSPQKLSEHAQNRPTPTALSRVGKDSYRERIRYSFLGLLGRGAMGEVHVVRDEDLRRKVAFKRMVPEVIESSELAARFFSEAQITAQLDHPHIVPIYGLEIDADGSLGYTMKLVHGRTLSEVLADARKRSGDASEHLAGRLELFLKVSDAMSFAHSRGVLHRDLKPDNIMIGHHNEVYVMDWGICRLIHSGEGSATMPAAPGNGSVPDDRMATQAAIGTPAYMSPEQANGRNEELDARSDLYTLGLILFEIVTLRRARQGGHAQVVLARAASGRIEQLVHHDPRTRLARELKAIVAKATAVDRLDRYESVAELAADLRRYLRGDAVAAAPDNIVQKAARWVARNRLAALSVIASLLLLAAGVVIVSLQHERFAIEEAHHHERAMEAFVSAAQNQARSIDERLFGYERVLAELASYASEALADPDPGPEAATYFSEDFKTPGRQPPDLAESRFYRGPISLDWPVVVLAPEVLRSAATRELSVLAELRQPLQGSVLLGAMAGETEAPLEAARARFSASGGTIVRSFVTLASGVQASYPGTGDLPPRYDPRQSDEYQLAAGRHGLRWGTPYRDPSSQRLLLPASRALYAGSGKLAGVVGIVTSLEPARRLLLDFPGSGVEEMLLVDGEARVITRSGNAEDGLGMSAPFELTPVRAAILEHRRGLLELTTDRGSRAVAFYPLRALGWYFVVVADPALLPSTETTSSAAIGRRNPAPKNS
jgi:serine/threonine-protein kinase